MKNVLIVDDDLNLIRQVELILKEINCQSVGLVEPEHIQDALKQDLFDLILLDVHMPLISGERILKQIKDDILFEDIPVIMLTADTNAELLSRCFHSGAVDFITKPIESIVLKARVNSAIKTHQNVQRMREFIGIVSHDLRSPVGNLMSYCDLLKVEPELFPECVDDMMSTAKRAHELVNDLLDLTAMEEGKINIQLKKCFFPDILTPLLKEIKPQAAQKEIQIRLDLSEDNWIKADPKRLSQVFSNLLQNSIKFTHKKGEITIKSESQKNGLKISIIDNGVGISLDKQKNLFSKYIKSSTLGTNNEEGTGYGLPLSQEIIHEHSSEIVCQSNEGEGSTFSFILSWW